MERLGASFALTDRFSARGAAAFQRVPPPYRLVCDLALLPLWMEAGPAAHWAGVPIVSLLGQAPLLVMLARYHRAEYGPERVPLLPPKGHHELYKEIACALVVKGSRGSELTFPQLWVESPDPTPLELGWHYGFPKEEATLAWMQDGRTVQMDAWDSQGPILSFEGRIFGRLPAGAVLAASAFRGLFPKTGRKAPMWVESAARVSFLHIRQFTAPRLEMSGTPGRSPVGLWLEQATLFLGAPLEPQQDKVLPGPWRA